MGKGAFQGLLMSIMGVGGIVSSKISSYILVMNNNLNQSNIKFLILFITLSVITFIFIIGLLLLKKL
jgi:hypothetical protein